MTDTTTRTSDNTRAAPPSGDLDPEASTPGAYALWYGQVPAPLVPLAEYGHPYDLDKPAPLRTGWYVTGLGTESDVEMPVAVVDDVPADPDEPSRQLGQEDAKAWAARQIERHTDYRVKGWRLYTNGDPDEMGGRYRQAWVPQLARVEHTVRIETAAGFAEVTLDTLAWRVVQRQLTDADEVVKVPGDDPGSTRLFPVRNIASLVHSESRSHVPQFDPFEVPF